VSTGGRAGRRHLPNPFGASPPFRRGCHPPPEREQESRPGRESRWQAMPNEPKPVAPRPVKGGTRPRYGSSRSIPRNDRSPVGTPSTHWWRYASRDRTHRSARDWQRYVVGKVPLSPQAAEDPGAGAGGVATIKVAGARAGELAAGSVIEPGGRLKGLGTHPSPSATQREGGPAADLGQWRLCTGVCTTLFLDRTVSRSRGFTDFRRPSSRARADSRPYVRSNLSTHRTQDVVGYPHPDHNM